MPIIIKLKEICYGLVGGRVDAPPPAPGGGPPPMPLIAAGGIPPVMPPIAAGGTPLADPPGGVNIGEEPIAPEGAGGAS